MPLPRRPYRSHKTPACDRCRRFKRRCTGGDADEPCVLCKLQNVPCQPSEIAKSGHRHANSKGWPKRASNAPPNQQNATTLPQESLTPPCSANHVVEDPEPNSHDAMDVGDARADSSIVVSPMLIEDIQMLERYFSTGIPGVDHLKTTDGSEDSLVYVKVPRRREGLAIAKNPGIFQREMIWQIIRPHANELIRLYFLKYHPAFPILDRKAFIDIYAQGYEKISPALFCEFFAATLTVWDHSSELKRHTKPDYKFVWNLAVEALQQDFLAPGLSTICSVLFDMTGRPIFGVLGNTINNGRAVALARSLGLNHNPKNWKRPASEKALRIRLWWAILIHDYWSSFAHGIPPNINNRQFDVPLPDLTDLTQDGQPEEVVKSLKCFVYLCSLSVILGEILPLVYDMKLDVNYVWRQLRRLESDLDDWQEGASLPLHGPNEKYTTSISGLSSLCLCYLSARLLLCRIAFQAAGRSQDIDRTNIMQYHMAMLRRAAQDISGYICSLTHDQLHEFWLVYTAHILTFTFFILLRCTVDTRDEAVFQSCKFSIDEFWAKLHQFAEKEEWDLANICLSRCAEPMSKIMSLLNLQKGSITLPMESIRDANDLSGATEQCPVDDPDNTISKGLFPTTLALSNLDMWFEGSSDRYLDGLDMGLANMPFIDQEFDMGVLNS